MKDIVGNPMVSICGGSKALSLIAIACICLCIALMTESASGESALNRLSVSFNTANSTVDPNGSVSSVEFNVLISASYYEGNTSYWATLRIDDPDFSMYKFDPEIVYLTVHRSQRMTLNVYVRDDIPAGTYEIPVSAHTLSNYGTYRIIDVGNFSIDVLSYRSVPAEFVGGNIVPYYHDIPQITHHLLLSNGGNTDERVLFRYLTNGEEVNVSVWEKGQNHEVGPEDPIELAPGEYVPIDVVFFIDGIPDEDGMLPITIEVVSSEDGQVLGTRDSQVYKLRKDAEEEPLNRFHLALSVAVVVLLALLVLQWIRGGRSQASSA